MANQEFDDIGEKIQDIIDKAVKSQDFQKLSRDINQAVNKAVDTGSEALKNALNNAFNNPQQNARTYEKHKGYRYRQTILGKTQYPHRSEAATVIQKETNPALYGSTGGERAKGVLMTTFGGILTGGMGIGFLVTLIVALAAPSELVGVESVMYGTSALLGAFTAGSAWLLSRGCSSLSRLKRFKGYVRALGDRTYCDFTQLSRMVGKPVKYVKKDITFMIGKGWFREGRIDSQETCLITSNETYRQYEEARKQLENREKAAKILEEARKNEKKNVTPEVQEVLDRGNAYILKIRQSNDAIPGEEISNKISRMELIVQKIFQRAEEHPEVIPDLKRLMDYYLPMTIKLLDAYEDMDNQPFEGENIQNSKREIETTLDTLNGAFEKILDSIFKDTAWDVSSDISVLNTVLAQEGLTEDEFSKIKKEAANR